MNNLNSVLLEGNLVRDPLTRTTPKGTLVATMSVASNRYYTSENGYEKEVSFFDVEAWAKLAESVEKLGYKGRGVRVVGRLKQDRWVGTDGKNRAKIVIVAEHVEFRPEFKKGSVAHVDSEENSSLADTVLKDEEFVNEEDVAETAEDVV